jgi:hypothetical protein
MESGLRLWRRLKKASNLRQNSELGKVMHATLQVAFKDHELISTGLMNHFRARDLWIYIYGRDPLLMKGRRCFISIPKAIPIVASHHDLEQIGWRSMKEQCDRKLLVDPFIKAYTTRCFSNSIRGYMRKDSPISVVTWPSLCWKVIRGKGSGCIKWQRSFTRTLPPADLAVSCQMKGILTQLVSGKYS